jgi:3-mercaptopyruvate sulfurtransferase SseA
VGQPDQPARPPSPYSLEGGFLQIRPEDLHTMIQKQLADPTGHMMVVIDVRPEADYMAGHVPGALSVPFERLSDTIRSSSLDSCLDIPIAVIGEAASLYPGIPGTTGAQANVRLRKVFGFSDVVSLLGGMPMWEAAGLPISQGRT